MSLSILVIEDETTIRENIVETLELSGYTAFSAPDGRSGVELARVHHPNLIICDIMMEGMDGYGVLELVRQDPDIALIPFIFITARADRQSMRQGMELGADDYIIKPFTTDELLRAVRTRLERIKAIGDDANAQLESVKQELVRVVAHELRTPLTAINMSVDLLSREMNDLGPNELYAVLETLNNGSNRLNRLVEQMTYVIQLRTGALNTRMIARAGMDMDIWTLIVTAVNLARRFAYRETTNKISISGQEHNAIIKCDREAVRHALAEIICNALSYSDTTATVTITIWQAEGGIWISILDQGRGMTPEQIEHALAAFSQVDRDKHEQQGIGMGLFIAKSIIEIHGGRLDIKSAVNKGTEVIVGFPIAG